VQLRSDVRRQRKRRHTAVSTHANSNNSSNNNSSDDVKTCNISYLNQNFGGRMLHVEKLENCGAVIRDRHVAELVDWRARVN
jgi:hypothetical protein